MTAAAASQGQSLWGHGAEGELWGWGNSVAGVLSCESQLWEAPEMTCGQRSVI